MSVSRETPTLSVSRETLERLELYVRLLLAWNSRINLIGSRDAGEVWVRHIQDALQLAPLIPPGVEAAIDLGSGAGLPGLVLALATGITFTLIEADQRKAAFLQEAARQTQARVTILSRRIERAPVAPASLVTARALAPLPRLIELAIPHLSPGGTLLFPKGATVEKEIEDARTRWTMQIERHISQTGQGGVILRMTGVQRA